MYLFSINKKGTILINPEAVKLCPELSVLDEKEVRFLILSYDYESPFNQQPEVERLHRAKNMVYDNEPGLNTKDRKWLNAVEAYKSLQYNAKREMMRVYEKKLTVLSAELATEDSTTKIKSILESQKLIRTAIKELMEDLVETEEKRVTIRGGGQLSFIEQMMSNIQEYKRITRPK